MNRPRDRASAAGLLPRMEARPWRDGKTTTYRYHAANGKPINLGTDRAEALRRAAVPADLPQVEIHIAAMAELYTAEAA